MVKAYLRYEFSEAFGVVTSNSNPLFDASGKIVITSSLESISLWNVKQGVLVAQLVPEGASSTSASLTTVKEVTVMARAPLSNQLAAGYSDGSISLWNLDSYECTATLKGHKSAVSCLRFSASGDSLASGSKDTDVILWDVLAEAGLVRLRGHRDQVTDLAFIPRLRKLATCSKDGLLKIWDLDTQHCCQTITGYKAEIWSLDVDPAQRRLVTGATDNEIRVFTIAGWDNQDQEGAGVSEELPAAPQGKKGKRVTAVTTDAAPSAVKSLSASSPPAPAGVYGDVLKSMGVVKRSAHERVGMIRFSADGGFLACQSVGKSVELYRMMEKKEAVKKLKRRLQRRREKLSKRQKTAPSGKSEESADEETEDLDATEEAGAKAGGEKEEEDFAVLRATDEFEPIAPFSCKHKVKAIGWHPKGDGGAAVLPKGVAAQFAVTLSNNVVEVVNLSTEDFTASPATQLEAAGHRSDVRTLALSSDDRVLVSGSNTAVKVWTAGAAGGFTKCIATMASGYGLSMLVAPGNKHLVLGTKEGTLEVFDLGSGDQIHVEPNAHKGPVWSLCMLPDKSGFISGSADKTIKFWSWAVVAAATEGEEGPTTRSLRVSHTKTLEMSDDVLSVRCSPDGKLLAASLLDTTIKIYYLDSLRFFLSLYGHKLPALCLDISSDSTLLISGGADKNIRVWGLDFGDCHKSLFAHNDAVTTVGFVPNTHYVFSGGKDGMVKYWDLDRNELLMELRGHHGEVWSLAVSAYGDKVFTASHDRSIRRWERTNEPFFVEEEKEKRLESLFEADLEQQDREQDREAGAVGEAGAAAPSGRRTLESVSAADAIVDALEIAANEVEKLREAHTQAAGANGVADGGPKSTFDIMAAAALGAGVLEGVNEGIQGKKAPPAPNPVMMGLSPSAFVLRAVSRVRANDLEQALLLLNFADALRLLSYLPAWLDSGANVELTTRVAALVVRLHLGRLRKTAAAKPVLLRLFAQLRAAVAALKDTVGLNLAGIRLISRQIKEMQA